MNQKTDEDILDFSEEEDLPAIKQRNSVWRVLIVDDDADVHSATTFALSNLDVHHRPLEFLHAYSAAEAKRILPNESDIAAILLDVVMEEEDSGLKLVRVIREELGLTEVRIILRTGQPGYAPEIDAVREYDINDYKTKSELTRTKLFTTITAAVRSYEQIRSINISRRGLDIIIRASSELMALHGLQSFASGVITQITGLLGLPPESLVCAQSMAPEGDKQNLMVIAAAGRYEPLLNCPIETIKDAKIRNSLIRCMQERRNFYEEDATVLYFSGRTGRNMATYLDTQHALDAVDRQLLDVFCSNIVVGLDNVAMFSQLHDFAFFDPLTALPNRRCLLDLIEERLASKGDAERGTMLLALLDIDHFGETNDALGHQFGDQLLKAVAARLTTNLGKDVAVARLGADVFGVFGNMTEADPERLIDIFKTPFRIEKEDLPVTVSIGLLRISDAEGSTSDSFIKDASIALKRAKTKYRGHFYYFTRDMGVDIRERVNLLHGLRSAFEFDRLFQVYQPQVLLADGRPTGAEALLRWRTEDGKFVPPDRFIPMAESSGMIISIGEWVLRTALHELMRLRKHGFTDFVMAVNVSVCQFRDPGFLAMLHRAMNDTGADPANVELEITESIAMEGSEFMIKTLNEIKHLGFSISVDDFGTGYSSLSHLQKLNVDRLKIDKAFVDEIIDSERGSSIAQMVVNLGRNLDLNIIAEGVEDERQAVILRNMGCHEAQGYFYGRPMPADQHMEWLKSKLK